MRIPLTALLFLFTISLPAQLRVGADAGATFIKYQPLKVVSDVPFRPSHPAWLPVTLGGTRGRAPYIQAERPAAPAAFDFAAARPYLAFFCRLELDIEEATRFPVRFRLGEVRGWQQELTRRD
ncbi:hypothetical protein [Neolewinella litorea]|uniref:Uncharacterized protein n=1 Tax=Neolewinella litorea TaxID=2562452 RepID=A0A4S4NPF0_9BACT|nr:hypothetical protein [Neolewinella litorea]THH41919.1 hypothetical protein E4021_04835 [Neolewinella litorea]